MSGASSSAACGEAQADGVLAVARLHQRVADQAPDRLGGVRHALAEHAPDLEQLAPWQPGVDEALDHARGLDVLVGEDALAAPRVGAPDGLHELAQEGRRQARLARHVAERVAARAAERELDGQRRQALLGVRALDLLVVGARRASRQALASSSVRAIAHRSIQARIWSYTAGWLSRSKWVSAADVVAVLDGEADLAPAARARGAGDAHEQVAEDRAQRVARAAG